MHIFLYEKMKYHADKSLWLSTVTGDVMAHMIAPLVKFEEEYTVPYENVRFTTDLATHEVLYYVVIDWHYHVYTLSNKLMCIGEILGAVSLPAYHKLVIYKGKMLFALVHDRVASYHPIRDKFKDYRMQVVGDVIYVLVPEGENVDVHIMHPETQALTPIGKITSDINQVAIVGRYDDVLVFNIFGMTVNYNISTKEAISCSGVPYQPYQRGRVLMHRDNLLVSYKRQETSGISSLYQHQVQCRGQMIADGPIAAADVIMDYYGRVYTSNGTKVTMRNYWALIPTRVEQ